MPHRRNGIRFLQPLFEFALAQKPPARPCSGGGHVCWLQKRARHINAHARREQFGTIAPRPGFPTCQRRPECRHVSARSGPEAECRCRTSPPRCIGNEDPHAQFAALLRRRARSRRQPPPAKRRIADPCNVSGLSPGFVGPAARGHRQRKSLPSLVLLKAAIASPIHNTFDPMEVMPWMPSLPGVRQLQTGSVSATPLQPAAHRRPPGRCLYWQDPEFSALKPARRLPLLRWAFARWP